MVVKQIASSVNNPPFKYYMISNILFEIPSKMEFVQLLSKRLFTAILPCFYIILTDGKRRKFVIFQAEDDFVWHIKGWYHLNQKLMVSKMGVV